MIKQPKHLYGLIGKNLGHSFSKTYFEEKFKQLDLADCAYQNFELDSIKDLNRVIETNPNLIGLNVTMPFKEDILNYLDSSSEELEHIKACNCVHIVKEGGRTRLKGSNTDIIGFKKSLEVHLKKSDQKALVFGTGGASKAVQFVLQNLGISFQSVGRNSTADILYNDITEEHIDGVQLLINATPLGMYPDLENKVEIPYNALNEKHYLYDLIYNPEKTEFLKEGIKHGCRTQNGLQMLQQQAEAAWETWNR